MVFVDLSQVGLVLFGVVLFFALIGAFYAGGTIGLWRRPGAEQDTEGVGFVVTGMLGLLAFSLGLTLSMAQGRFEARRAASLQEANAIGTAWLRAQGIGHPRGEAIAGLLEDYTRLRIEFVRAGPDRAGVDAMNRRTNAMQNQIWGHVAAIVRERTDPVAAALQASLNDTFDMSTAQRWAFAATLPQEMSLLLLGMSVLTIGGIGYLFGLKGRRHPFASLMLIAMWAAAITTIADLSTPRIGAVRVDTQVYEWTLQGFQGGITIPPTPAPR